MTTTQHRILGACIGITLFLASLALIWSVLDMKRVIAEAKSPDGTWGVAVVGQRMILMGGIEVHVEVRDGEGKPLPGSFVIGDSDDWDGAKRTFGEVACDNTQATVNEQVILKKDFVKP